MLNQAHVSEEMLERYVMGALADDELAEVEEHLLICSHCQDRCEREEEFVQAARAALGRPAATLNTAAPPKRSFRIFLWAGGLAAVAATIIIVAIATRPPAEQIVLLIAQRGSEAAAGQASSSRALKLSIDAQQLPPHPAYRVEVADSAGTVVWQGERQPSAGRIEADTGRLVGGNYWVRVYPAGASSELLREFALSVK